VYVSYRREAYVTPDDSSVRVTFDRQIAATTFTGAFDGRRSGEVHILPVDGVVLEVKFTDRFPGWVANMARMFELERLSFAKYVHCVMQLPRTGARLWRMPRPAAREVVS
jgi:SPX domain protein involved in polyphosphate accumulation